MKGFAFFADDYEEGGEVGFIIAESKDRATKLLLDEVYSTEYEIENDDKGRDNYYRVLHSRLWWSEHWYISQAIEIDKELIVFPYRWEREHA